jgi:hypothetical protein
VGRTVTVIIASQRSKTRWCCSTAWCGLLAIGSYKTCSSADWTGFTDACARKRRGVIARPIVALPNLRWCSMSSVPIFSHLKLAIVSGLESYPWNVSECWLIIIPLWSVKAKGCWGKGHLSWMKRHAAVQWDSILWRNPEMKEGIKVQGNQSEDSHWTVS